MQTTHKKLTALAAAATISLGGGATLAAGATTGTTGATGTSGAQERQHPNETPLTGETATKVRAAALAKLPGASILRVETDDGGVYEAHVRKSDGTEVEVKVDKAFAVTAVETRPAGGRGGPGGRHGARDTAALAKALGVTQATLDAALTATRPARPANGAKPTERPDRSAMAAVLAKELGLSTATVQAALEADRPPKP